MMKSSIAMKPFARERLAGYDPELLNRTDVACVGAGALANNVLLNQALAGVGGIRVIDFDMCEVSNATRSPLMRLERLTSGIERPKAYEACLGFLANAYAATPRAHGAVARVERLGLGAFDGAAAIVCAVDSNVARGWVSDAGMLLGLPVVEAGFNGHVGQVTVFRHDDPDGPCWRCLNPNVEQGSASCTLYAQAVLAAGRAPATQPTAAMLGAMVAHAVIALTHGDHSYASTMLAVDLARGTSRRVEVARNPRCPGPHRRLAPPVRLAADARASLAELFEELSAHGPGPSLVLPSPFVVRLPCRDCGRPIAVGRPANDIDTAPRCKECGPPNHGHAPLAYAELGSGLLPRSMRVGRLGLRAGGIMEVGFEDDTAGVFRLAGDALADFRNFRTKRRNE
jgi:molybdopterin/thiamine biosynthesis adenylyltransferase